MGCCKVCFEQIKKQGLNSFINEGNICQKCYNNFDVIFHKQIIDGIEVLSLYDYNDFLKNILFQFKGCFDIELKKVFLERHLLELKIKFRNYIIVPIPSTIESDEEREFNHVCEIFSSLDLPIFPCLKKKFDFKQSNLSKKEREKVKQKLFVIDGEKLKDKKVLIVDDVLTTGSSIKASIELLKKYKPKKMKGLVVAEKCRNM